MLKTIRGGVQQLWRLAGPFWTSKEGREDKGSSRAIAYVLLVTIIAMSFGMVYLSVLINDWRRDFYNSLQSFVKYSEPPKTPGAEEEEDNAPPKKLTPEQEEQVEKQLSSAPAKANIARTWHLILLFSVYAFSYVFVGTYSVYLRGLLSIRWRKWMTTRYMNFYLAGNAYYHWNLSTHPTDNPDQRLTEDIREFIDNTLSLTLDVIQQVTNFITFSIILYGLSVPVFIFGYELPGSLMWSAYLYAFTGTALIHLVGRKLRPLKIGQQKLEADFRYSLIRVRENAESIALSQGAPAENRHLRMRFGEVVKNFLQIMWTTKQVNLVGITYSQGANIFPLMLLLGGYFRGKIKWGNMMQAYEAFGYILDALSFFVSSYSTLAEWRAIMSRLNGFLDTVEAAHAHGPVIDAMVQESPTDRTLSIRDVKLSLPNGTTLREGINLNIAPGEALLIAGNSGTGKSTLLRSTAGLWPSMTGQISLPKGAKIMFLPQKPYLPVDTLAAALSYPLEPTQFDPKLMTDYLTLLRLGHLIPRLEESANWALIVSGGEAQRIAVIRALLQKPNWLFLDEATSALDEEMQTIVYQTLKAQLPNTTIISVGHRETLEAFHQQRYDFVTGNSTRLPT